MLVVNAGSSSLKLRLVDDRDTLLDAQELGGDADAAAIGEALRGFEGVDAVGHRIVHGGHTYRDAVVVDAEVDARLRGLVELAPLHQPRSLAALDAARAALPRLPHVACFDTAFHATLPDAAATYALPHEWRARWALRRYGFHGLSHAYASRRAAALIGKEVGMLRIVTCHLGAGASLAAVAGGRSVDTTMGFTPLEGLVMATRAGSVDPGLLLWLIERAGLAPEVVADALEHRSGLFALAGTSDMRALLARPDGEAEAALSVYLHRLRASIAQMAAALEGLDALVFTGGVGENAPEIRSGACQRLTHLGIRLDEQANRSGGGDGEIGDEGAHVLVLVVHAREDVEIARQVRALLR